MHLQLFLLGLLSAVGLVYASLVPFHFRPLDWAEAVERFGQIPWLQLGVYRRADWVANGLVAMPFGFLLAGAADFRQRLTGGYLGCLLLITLFGNGLIVLIEFLQLWFPPRTVSQNDILAGCIGATISPWLWMFVGRPTLHAWQRLSELPWTAQHVARLAWGLALGYCALVLVYSAMPLDVMLSPGEWKAKWNEGRFDWIGTVPLTGLDSPRAWLHLISVLAFSAARLVPLGFLVGHAKRGPQGIWLLIGFPILIELVQAPIFTRHTTLADLVCGWAGGIFGLWLATQTARVLRWNAHWPLRLGVVIAVIGIALVAFLGRYERWATADEVAEHWQMFWAPPFAKYYYTSEYSAGSNLAGKLIVFGVIGFLMANLFNPLGQPGKRNSTLPLLVTLFTALILGVVIEVSQIYLVPLVADASDVIIYSCGAGIAASCERRVARN